ncbi:hypothetical protein [Streptomyces tibetensis]|uniref:hypothetical protein n=1 Tax=Streptomyces tibetensis TaxID=2382123 RepID=UPI00340BC4AA
MAEGRPHLRSGGDRRRLSYGGAPSALLRGIEGLLMAGPGGGPTEVGVQHAMCGDRGDAGRARDVVQQQRVPGRPVGGGGVHDRDDLGAA